MMRIQSTLGHRRHHLLQQLRQPIFHPQVVTVIGGILGDQDQLVHAHLLQLAGFLQDGFRWAADRGALDQRDGAKGARAAAAIGNLQVGAAPLDSGMQHLALIQPDGWGFGQVVERRGVRTLAQPVDHLDNIHPAPRAQDAINARHLADHLRAVALGQAAGRDQQLPGALVRCQLAQHLQRLFPGRADEAAGIDDQHPRLAGFSHRPVASLGQQLPHARPSRPCFWHSLKIPSGMYYLS